MEVLELDGKDDVTLRDIQKILYSTEVSLACCGVCDRSAYKTDLISHAQDGFEVPEGGTQADEEETF